MTGREQIFVYKLYTFFDGCNVLVLPLQHFTFVLNQIALTTMKRLLNRMLRFYKIKAASFFRRVTRLLKKTTRLETAEKPDAGRVALSLQQLSGAAANL